MNRISIEALCGLPEKDAPAYDCFRQRAAKHSPARDAVHAAIIAQAGRTSRAMIKQRARAYTLRPRELDSLEDGLSSLCPRVLVWTLAIASTAMSALPPRRHFGFGGEVPAICLRGAMLYARFARAKARGVR